MTTNERKAREFWIREFRMSLFGGVPMIASDSMVALKDEDINWEYYKVREVLPDQVSDTERLEWMIANLKRMTVRAGLWHVYPCGKVGYENPREAIDAAMKESGK
jgi:hypothetical protein